MRQFFLGQMYLELQMNDEATRIYTQLSKNGFSNSTYVMAQIALSYHNLRGTRAKAVSRQCCVYSPTETLLSYWLTN